MTRLAAQVASVALKGMDLHRLTANWTADGEPGEAVVGELSLRRYCA